jgi:GABA permease
VVKGSARIATWLAASRRYLAQDAGADGELPLAPGWGRAGYLKRVVAVRRYLVVANQTLQAAELRDELRKRISAGPCSFFVIVPDTTAAQYDPVAAGGVLPQPGMWWWATYYARPATDEEATAQARERLSVMLAGLAALGAPVEGDLGSPDPLAAIRKACDGRQFDEIIVTTLPQHVSRWLRTDLPRQAERRFGLPVTTIMTSY